MKTIGDLTQNDKVWIVCDIKKEINGKDYIDYTYFEGKVFFNGIDDKIHLKENYLILVNFNGWTYSRSYSTFDFSNTNMVCCQIGAHNEQRPEIIEIFTEKQEAVEHLREKCINLLSQINKDIEEKHTQESILWDKIRELNEHERSNDR